MIATKSYVDENGVLYIDGERLQFVRRQQNLTAKPSRHRKQQALTDDNLLKISLKEASINLFVFAAFFSVMAWIASIIL